MAAIVKLGPALDVEQTLDIGARRPGQEFLREERTRYRHLDPLVAGAWAAGRGPKVIFRIFEASLVFQYFIFGFLKRRVSELSPNMWFVFREMNADPNVAGLSNL